tara:strand:- start:1663 stop:2103 length:441 start_codon:yes stop_codon:yes gene_type:complete
MTELILIIAVFFIGRFSVRQDTSKRIRLDDVANWMIQAINACGGNHHDVRNLFQQDLEDSVYINIDQLNRENSKYPEAQISNIDYQFINDIKQAYLSSSEIWLNRGGIARYIINGSLVNDFDASKKHPKTSNPEHLISFYKRDSKQ